jgi:predicted helicase
MSVLLVADYQRRIAELVQYGGSANEDSIRKAFARLLDDVARARDLRLIEELEVITPNGAKVYPDGTLKDALRLTHGYWEAKDEYDDIDEEVRKKRAKGYPVDNIVFEDSRVAILIQDGSEVQRVSLSGEPILVAELLRTFVEFERPELADFRRAIEKFKQDLPKVLDALRSMIEAQQTANEPFSKSLQTFLKLCQSSINASVTSADVREMLIQHILTEDIFLRVFGEGQFHRENNIARELTRVAETFFTGGVKKNMLRGLESYYGAIRGAAAGIADHHEKQQFLKAIYENFYKVYNPKLADRLGVVYTPSELVRFMLDGVDALLHRHFKRTLASRNVEILDPAVGTGTFITDLIEHLKAHPDALKHKYKNEIHCNEVAILPYYIANLNIEFTYAQLAGVYEEFPHICFVDTLDNLGFEKTHTGQQLGLLGSLSAENTDRIAKQNQRKISVVIGNPPYNANQANENDDNRNRLYIGVDERIKKTWVAASAAQKTKMYDMYARFFRWAADRVNSDGVVAFVTNRSFIDSRTFDGFRLQMVEEFDEAWVIDLGGDIRANPKLSGTTHNVFGIQTGVAVSFWVKKHRDPKAALRKDSARVHYARRPEFESAADKLSWLSSTRFNDVPFEPVTPDVNGNWINQVDNDFERLLPLASKSAKRSTNPGMAKAIFWRFAAGVKTNRDDWVYDHSAGSLSEKVKFFNERLVQAAAIPSATGYDPSIKWSRDLKLKVARGPAGIDTGGHQVTSEWRPFVKKHYWANKSLSDVLTSNHFAFYGDNLQKLNPTIAFLCVHSSNPIAVLATESPFDYCFLKQGNGGTESVARWILDETGSQLDNITSWAPAAAQLPSPVAGAKSLT